MQRVRFLMGICFVTALVMAGTLFLLGDGAGVAAQATVQGVESVSSAVYDDQRPAGSAAVGWLVTTHQNDDGGYTSFSSGANVFPSDVGGTVDAILAIGSAGYNPAGNAPSHTTNPISYLRNNPTAISAYAQQSGGTNGKLIQALVTAGQDPYDFASYNLVISLTNHLSPTGQYNANTAFDQSLAMLALAAVREPIPMTATQWLMNLQAVDGSWDDGFGTTQNADATAMAVMALVAAGEPVGGASLMDATQFFANAQLPSGGWEYGAGFGENVNSTGLVLQALSALGENFYDSGTAWDQAGNTPLVALLDWQSPSGAFQADFGTGPFDDFFSTIQALPAVTGWPYPLPGRYESARQAVACLDTIQDPATSGWEQFASFGVNAGGTSRAIQAIAAFGEDPTSARWTNMTGTHAMNALENDTPAYLAVGRGGRVGIVLQGVAAGGSGYTATNFAGYDLVISMTNYLSPTGLYDAATFGPMAQAEAMLGLMDAGFPVDPTAVAWLLNAQTNGDWLAGADGNGIAINVLGRLDLKLYPAYSVLHDLQEADGGWGFGVPSSPNSSSEAVQGLVSSGFNPFDPSWSQIVEGRISNAAHAVMAQQAASGCWLDFFGTTDDPFATTDAVLLLLARPEWYNGSVLYMPIVIGD